MKISVVMVDGGFRENVHAAVFFSDQDFPEEEYEVIWVEYFDRVHPEVVRLERVRSVTLDREGTYHSSFCFNCGIAEAAGELLVIPDADQVVPPDFLSRVWDIHRKYERLVAYGYRYDERKEGDLRSLAIDELDHKCVLKNPANYGGCMTVRREWLLALNGYEQHPLFGTGNHANGLDMYTRFKNYGLAVLWEPTLKLYHPHHPFTLMHTEEHRAQGQFIEWRRRNLHWRAVRGIDPGRNEKDQAVLDRIDGIYGTTLSGARPQEDAGRLKSTARKLRDRLFG